ncbi:MAG: MBL fold metallo-hydrolase [Planctomycetota bacterium]
MDANTIAACLDVGSLFGESDDATASGPGQVNTPARQRNPSATGSAVCNLGSGSGGNCTAVRVGGVTEDGRPLLLIDAGFGPRTTAQRLAQAGHTLGDVAAVLLTHLDRDHFRPTWLTPLIGLGIAVYCDRWHAEELLRLPGATELRRAGLLRAIEAGGERFAIDLNGRRVRVATHRCQHDRQGTVAYRLDLPGGHRRRSTAIGYATDLGHVPRGLVGLFAGVDLLCLEANYDERMTIHSPRPSFVNRRNLSDSGHLSNEQALDAVRAVCDVCPAGGPTRVLLMHRSSQCNHPTKLRRVFAADPSIARRVTLTDQRRRTRWFALSGRPAVMRCQLTLRA